MRSFGRPDDVSTTRNYRIALAAVAKMKSEILWNLSEVRNRL